MEEPEVINARASKWTKRGIALLTENTPQTLRESLRCFDEAINLRRTLPLPKNAWYRYLLAGGFMNRADALTRLGRLDHAVSSYDDALALLQTLDLDEDPRFRQRLALAWMNRGVILQEQGSPAAVTSFENAVIIAPNPAVLAASLANYGNALLQLSPPELVGARDAFEQALRLVAGQEETDVDLAEIGIKARHGICRTLAWQLTEKADADLVTTVTDAMEDALKRADYWRKRGDSRFDKLARELILFGAQAYRRYQPHFVAEFLTEMLTAFPEPLAAP